MVLRRVEKALKFPPITLTLPLVITFLLVNSVTPSHVEAEKGEVPLPPPPAEGKAGEQGQVRSFTIRVTKDGFNDTSNLKITVRLNDIVNITFIYADVNSDVHQLYLSGYDIYAPNFSPESKTLTMMFVATDTGKFGLHCRNEYCKAHPNLDMKVIVAP